MNINVFDLLSAILGLLFTVMVLSYLIGDNAFFRMAVHLFIGVSAGVVVVLAWNNVLWPRLIMPLLSGSMDQMLFVAVPGALSLLLLAKLSKPMARLGNLSMAVLAGTSAAVAVSGALTGTLIPQIMAAVDLPSMGAAVGDTSDTQLQYLVEGIVALFATLATLIYFQFGVSAQASGKRSGLMRILALIGQIFIGITLGAIFAGTYAAAVTALIERVYAFVRFLNLFFVF